MRGISVGVDIGTTAITTVVAKREKRDGKFRILGVGRVPVSGMRRGTIVDLEEVTRALSRSLHEAGREAKVKVRSATVGIGGSHLSSFATRGVVAVSRADGEITDEDVRRALRAAEGFIPKNPNREVIHVIPHGFRVDGEAVLRDPFGLVGMKLEVETLVIDGARAALSNLVKCFESVDVDIEDWAVSALAAAETVLSKTQKELGALFLDLGGGTTDFAIFEEGRLVDLGTFPIGGSHITSDIAIGLKTDIAVAEAVKRRYARIGAKAAPKSEPIRLSEFRADESGVTSEREVAEIVEARLSDIFELAARALKRIGRAGLLPGGVILSGGGAELLGIRELAKRELALPAEVVNAVTLDAVEGTVREPLITALALILWHASRHRLAYGGTLLPWSGFGARAKAFLRSFLP